MCVLGKWSLLTSASAVDYMYTNVCKVASRSGYGSAKGNCGEDKMCARRSLEAVDLRMEVFGVRLERERREVSWLSMDMDTLWFGSLSGMESMGGWKSFYWGFVLMLLYGWR